MAGYVLPSTFPAELPDRQPEIRAMHGEVDLILDDPLAVGNAVLTLLLGQRYAILLISIDDAIEDGFVMVTIAGLAAVHGHQRIGFPSQAFLKESSHESAGPDVGSWFGLGIPPKVSALL